MADADIKLIVGADPELSYEQFKKDIHKIINDLEASEKFKIKITVVPDKALGSAIQKQIIDSVKKAQTSVQKVETALVPTQMSQSIKDAKTGIQDLAEAAKKAVETVRQANTSFFSNDKLRSLIPSETVGKIENVKRAFETLKSVTEETNREITSLAGEPLKALDLLEMKPRTLRKELNEILDLIRSAHSWARKYGDSDIFGGDESSFVRLVKKDGSFVDFYQDVVSYYDEYGKRIEKEISSLTKRALDTLLAHVKFALYEDGYNIEDYFDTQIGSIKPYMSDDPKIAESNLWYIRQYQDFVVDLHRGIDRVHSDWDLVEDDLREILRYENLVGDPALLNSFSRRAEGLFDYIKNEIANIQALAQQRPEMVPYDDRDYRYTELENAKRLVDYANRIELEIDPLREYIYELENIPLALGEMKFNVDAAKEFEEELNRIERSLGDIQRAKNTIEVYTAQLDAEEEKRRRSLVPADINRSIEQVGELTMATREYRNELQSVEDAISGGKMSISGGGPLAPFSGAGLTADGLEKDIARTSDLLDRIKAKMEEIRNIQKPVSVYDSSKSFEENELANAQRYLDYLRQVQEQLGALSGMVEQTKLFSIQELDIGKNFADSEGFRQFIANWQESSGAFISEINEQIDIYEQRIRDLADSMSKASAPAQNTDAAAGAVRMLGESFDTVAEKADSAQKATQRFYGLTEEEARAAAEQENEMWEQYLREKEEATKAYNKKIEADFERGYEHMRKFYEKEESTAKTSSARAVDAWNRSLDSLEKKAADIKLRVDTGGIQHGIDTVNRLSESVGNIPEKLRESIADLGGLAQQMSNPLSTDEEIINAYAKYQIVLKSVTGQLRDLATAKREAAREEAAEAKAAQQAASMAERNEQKRESSILSVENALRKAKDAQEDWIRAGKSQDNPRFRNLSNDVKTLEGDLERLKNTSADTFSGTDFNRFSNDVKRTNNDIGALNRSLKSTGGIIDSITKTYLAPYRIFMAVIRQIRQMINVSIELDKEFTQLQVVTRATDAEMRGFSDTIVKTAQRIAISAKDLISATTTFARLGYTIEESAKLAEITGMLQNVGDIEASDAQNAITAIVKAFNVDVNDIESIADKLVVVGNNFPISVSQIAEGMNNAASSLAAAGNTFDQSVALLTAANTVVQNASKASTGLRTIAARLRNTTTDLEELGEDMTEAKYDELVKALTGLNVALVDVNGEYRSTYDIMKDIAGKWSQLTSMQQSALATSIAGTRQQAIFFSIIDQFKEASGAMDEMARSAGELEDAYSVYMDSVEAHINKFKTAFQELSQDVATRDLINDVVDLGTKLLDLVKTLAQIIDSLGGLQTLFPMIIGAAGLPKLLKVVPKIASAFGIAAKSGAHFSGVVKLISGSSISAAAGLGLLGAAIGTAIAAYNVYKQNQEEQRQAAQSAAEEFDNAAENADAYIAKIRELKDALENGNLSEEEAYDVRKELLSLQDEIEDFYGTEIENLNLLAQSADEAADAINHLTEEQARQKLRDNEPAYLKAVQEMTKEQNISASMWTSRDITMDKAPGYLQDDIKDALAGKRTIQKAFDGVYKFVGIYQDIYDDTAAVLDSINELQRKYKGDSTAQLYLAALESNIRTGYEKSRDAIDQNKPLADAWAALTVQTTDEYSGIADAIKTSESKIDEVLDGEYETESARLADLQGLVSQIHAIEDQIYGAVDNPTIRSYLLDQLDPIKKEITDKWGTLRLKVNLEAEGEGNRIKQEAEQALSAFRGADGKVSAASILNAGLGDPKTSRAQVDAYKRLSSIATSYNTDINGLIAVLQDLGLVEKSVAKITEETVKSAFDTAAVDTFKDSISALKSAFDDIGKDGSIGVTYSSLSSLKEKFADVSGIDTFIDRLLDAGTNAEDVTNILSELAYAKIESMEASGDLAYADERLVTAMLDEAGIANADKVAHEVLAKARHQAEVNAKLEKDGILSVIDSLDTETAYTIEAKNETIELAAKFLDLNRSKLDLSQQKAELYAIAQAAGVDIALLNAVKGAANTGSNYTAADFDMNARDPFGNPINAEKPSNVINAGASWDTIYDSVMKQINERISATARTALSFKTDTSSSSSSDGGGGSSVEKYIADIDKFYEALKRVEALEQRIDTLRSKIENSEDVDERVELTKQLINSYKEEAVAMQELNRQRGEGIQSAISDLQALGFVITYNAETHELLVRNMEHLNELEAGSTEATNELRKETEQLINDLESWNSANQQTEASLRGMTKEIREAREAMVSYLEEAVSKANEMVDGLQNVYDTLTNAAKEYAQTGYLSVDSLQSILALGPKYMAMLVDENGQLVINEQTLQKLIAARTEEMAAETALSYAKQILLATETGEVETLQQLTQVDIAASNATWDMAYATLALAKAIGTANGIQSDYYDSAFDYIKKMQSLTKTAVNTISGYYATLDENYISQKDALDKILQLTQDMIKHEQEDQIKALEDEKDRYADIINQKKEMIQLAKEQADREKNVQDKLAEIAKLQAKIAQLSLDDSREAQAQKSKLEEELAELQRSLADEQYGYSIDAQEDALDKQLEAYNAEKDQEIEGLQNMLSSAEKLYQAAIARINEGWDKLYGDLLSWNYEYGNTLESELVSAWDAATAAVQRYGSFVSALEGTAGHSDMGAYDNNPPGSESYTNYAAAGNEMVAKSIVERMKANSAQWVNADEAGRNALAAENERLGAELGQLLGADVYRDQNGVWWINGQKLYDVYHKGGIVGGDPTKQQEEVMALLEKGEAVLDEKREQGLYKIVDFVSVLSDKLGAALDSGRIGKVFGALSGLPNSFGSFANLTMPQLAAASPTYNIDRIEVSAPVYVSERLSDDDIREHARTIGAISADFIREGFTKRGVGRTASLF